MRAIRLGLALRGDTAVAVRRTGSAIEASVVATREVEEAWEDFLVRTLAAALETGWRRWRRVHTGVCVADARCRVVPLFGERDEDEADLVRARFHAAPHAYTLGGVDGLVPGSVWDREGGWQGVVLARGLADALVGACGRLGVALVGVAPSTDPAGDTLEALAADATTLAWRDPVLVDPDGLARVARTRRRRRRTLAALAAGAIAWAAAAPLVIARYRLAALEARAQEAESTLVAHRGRGPLAVRDEALRLLARAMRADRGHATGFLEGLARALPDSAAVTALRLDATGGSLTLLAPHAAEAVQRLAAVPTLRAARVLGAIVEEEHAGLVLQRVTLAWTTGGGTP